MISTVNRRLIGVGLTAAVGVAAYGIVAGGEHTQEAHNAARIVANEKAIAHVSRVLDGVVYLNDGVNVRSSMKIDDGYSNTSGARPANIRFTVGQGKYANKTLVVTRPAVLTDKGGNQWIAFDEPDTKNTTLHEQADHLGYVAIGEVALQSPGSIVVNPYKDGAPQPTELGVDYVAAGNDGGGFENSGTDQQVSYALTSTVETANGK